LILLKTNNQLKGKTMQPNQNTLTYTITPLHGFQGLAIAVDGAPVLATTFIKAARDLEKIKKQYPDRNVRQMHFARTTTYEVAVSKPRKDDALLAKYKEADAKRNPTAKPARWQKVKQTPADELINKPVLRSPRQLKLLRALIKAPANGETIGEIVARLNDADDLAFCRADELVTLLETGELTFEKKIVGDVMKWWTR
jgi:hypothetical protein